MTLMPRFARRTSSWSRSANALTQAVDARRASGDEVIDLTESNPTRCGLRYPGASILEALADPASLVYSPEPAGIASAREAVAADYASRGTAVPPDRVLLTAGTSEAYGYLFRLLADPGDRVLVPVPSYPLFELIAQIHDVTLIPCPLSMDGRFSLDLEMTGRLMADGAAAMLLVSPGNPTGTFLRRAEADALLQLAARHGVPLICDEVFGDYAWSDDALRQPTLAGRHESLVFVLNGISKMLALPQLKLAWIVASGRAPEVAESLRRLEILSDTHLSVGTPVQLGLARLLALRPAIQTEVLRRVRHNRLHLQQAVAAHPACRLLPAEGGWASILQVPRTMSDEQWALDLVASEGVLVHPGYFFEFPSEGHLVVSLLPEEEHFRAGITRLLARVSRDG
jgi:alanine-synthesizing transaminase